MLGGRSFIVRGKRERKKAERLGLETSPAPGLASAGVEFTPGKNTRENIPTLTVR
ncbi:hypothetical protein An12g09200 [Aspergillus niger]|uniref:Uncharacterized protein n=2 Tax=Aspergillus niger TaxID=5061 RepID=A2R0N3_ASPNC|nr:hypothetical protein An12g09200 [Aspergillus niger]CAK41350.1 hypothetical protein An12g09200 [Aspergillus niger]